MEAFVKSDIGRMTWNAHKHHNVSIVDSQSEWTPLQRNFLAMAADEHEPDPPKNANTPNSTNINAR